MGRLIGTLYTSAGVGALIAAPVAGFAIDRTGSYRWPIAVAALLALAGWALLGRLSGHVAAHHGTTEPPGVPLPA